MREIARKKESSARDSAANNFVTKCPACGHARSSVELECHRSYDGETDKWPGCKEGEVIEDGLETN